MSRSALLASTFAVAALCLIGTSFAATDELADYPAAGGQAMRYAVAGAILIALLHGRLPCPTRRELILLIALAASGLAAFNLLVLAAVARADPGSVGVVVGCVPLVLAIAGPLGQRRRPDPRVVLAALVVAAGAAFVQGFGGSMGVTALLLSLGALACEAAFSLLAAPVLPRLGALAVSAWACLLALPLLVTYALIVDGPGAMLASPTAREAVALAYLAAPVTALAFVCWYTAVRELGAERAGLFSGVLPVSAMLAAAALGSSAITPARLAGVVVVGIGVSAGLVLAGRTSDPVN